MDNNSKSTMFCWISLGCVIASFIFEIIVSKLPYGNFKNYFETIPFIFGVAAFVLMIVARVICKTNIFAKVLMWVYIAIIVGMIIFTVLCILFLVLLCDACFGSGDFTSCCDQLMKCGQIGITYVPLILKCL